MTALGAAGLAVALPSCRCSREDESTSAVPEQRRTTEPDQPDLAGFAPPTDEPTMRVRILTVRRGDEPVMLGNDGQWLQVIFDERTGRGMALRAPLTLQRNGVDWLVSDGSDQPTRTLTARTVIVRTLDADDAPIALGKRRYRGELRATALLDRDDVSFDVVNHLPMEQYLPGVLARELFQHWHPATFAAQAVAARSFAAHEHLHNEGRRHFDVTDTVSSQAYDGAIDHDTAHQAVQHTGGQVLAHDDLLVPGYYCSCCGGRSAPATAMMGSNPVNALPPLNGRAGEDVCTNAPLYRWQVTRPVDQLTRRLAAYGKRIGNAELAKLSELRSIEARPRTEGGRPLGFTITGASSGSIELSARQLRRACNFHNDHVPEPNRSLWSPYVQVKIEAGEARFDGRGHGHGVGLCQYGAEALARDAHGYLDILRWYYPGAYVLQAYDPPQRRRSLIG